MTLDYTEIRRLLAAARQAPGRDRVFGAAEHGFRLHPPCSAAEIEAVEARAGIRLPEDYRRFLLAAGNGGAGPGYGLNSLQRSLQYVAVESDLTRPFPHREAWNVENDTPGAAAYGDSMHVAGSIEVADYGCGIEARLVVRGPERGRMWIDNRTNDSGIHPFTLRSCASLHDRHAPPADDDRHLTFLEWYADWLSRSLATLGIGNRRGEMGRSSNG